MGSKPHKGKGRPDSDAPASEARHPHEPQDGNKLIQYPQRFMSPDTPAEEDHQPFGRTAQNAGPGVSVVERNIEEWRVIAAVLQGDVIEFRTLVVRYQNPIYHLMLRLSGHSMTAEDLTQDAFTRAYEKLSTFKKGNRFFSWLYTIATNIGRDYLRRKGLQNDLFSDKPFDAAWPDPDQDDCAKRPDCVMEVGQISEALNGLPERYSQTMLLYYREGLSAKEIAAALDISIAAVKVRIYRGRKLLKQKIGGDDETK